MKWPSLTGLAFVLILHGALLYGLLQHRLIPLPYEAKTLFIQMIEGHQNALPPEPLPTRRQPIKPEKKQVETPPPPQPLSVETPIESHHEPVVPLPQPAPQRIEVAPVVAVVPVESPAPPKQSGPLVLGGELALKCPERKPPLYPATSKRLREEGLVMVRAELDEEGRVEHASIKSSSGYERLDDAALNAVRQWRCHPAQRDGQPVRAVAMQPFNFVLEGR